jgi:hypothetical protein
LYDKLLLVADSISQIKHEEKGVEWEDDIPIESIMLSASEEYMPLMLTKCS